MSELPREEPLRLREKFCWTIKDVAKYLGCSKQTILNPRANGSFPVEALKVGRQLWFNPVPVDEWLTSQICIPKSNEIPMNGRGETSLP